MHIIDVNSDNGVQEYNRLVKKVPCMVLFHADWCGHCQNFKPEWKKFESLARQNHIKDDFMIARVNDSYISKVDGHSEVDGYPTVYHLINGKHNKSFSNSRDLNGLIEFLSEAQPNMRLMKGGSKKTPNRRYKKRSMKKTQKKRSTRGGSKRRSMKKTQKKRSMKKTPKKRY